MRKLHWPELLTLVPSAAADVTPLTDAVSVAVLPARIGAVVTTTLGAMATMLAAIGIYGLVSFTVAQRTKEIGIRKAVGAQTRDIMRLVVASSLVARERLRLCGSHAAAS